VLALRGEQDDVAVPERRKLLRRLVRGYPENVRLIGCEQPETRLPDGVDVFRAGDEERVVPRPE